MCRSKCINLLEPIGKDFINQLQQHYRKGAVDQEMERMEKIKSRIPNFSSVLISPAKEVFAYREFHLYSVLANTVQRCKWQCKARADDPNLSHRNKSLLQCLILMVTHCLAKKNCQLIAPMVWSLGNCWYTGPWLCLGHTQIVQYQGRKSLTPHKYYRMDTLQNQINPLEEKHANKWFQALETARGSQKTPEVEEEDM